MKKIYLKNNNGNLQASRIIDVDNLSFAFNRVDGSIYATATALAKTSDIIIMRHPTWKYVNSIDRLIFESDAMDKLSMALAALLSSNSNLLEIFFNCSETSVLYTFVIRSMEIGLDAYIDKFEISLPFEKEKK